MATDDLDGAMDVDPGLEGEDPEIIAQKIINEEYKVWKKNAHYLYDLFYSRVLDWPSLTAQWFPDKKVLEDEDKSVHRLLLGTHTTDEKQNYVQIAQFDMPLGLRPDPADYNPETEEIGGHGAAKKGMPLAKFNVTQKIPHDGEVNKARYMPHNPDLIATMTNEGKACIFDRTKHPSQPSPTAPVNPQIELVGHDSEGFALNWNPGKEGELATGSNDTTVKLWDITGYQKSSKTLKPVRTFTHHSAVVNDLEFHPALNWMIATVSDDLSLQILDTRKDTSSTAAKSVQQAHADAINAVSFNHASEYILATGSADKSIAIWDLRMLKVKLHALEGHQDVVTRIEWNPVEKQKHVLASAGHDRRITMWDLAAVGNEQTPEDAEDGPPELMFIHGGHTNRIADFSFNRHEPYLICSAAEDNLVHVWHPNDACLYGTENEDVSIEELEA